MKVYVLYTQAPDYHSHASAPKYVFESYDQVKDFIAHQPGWGGMGITTDWYYTEFETITDWKTQTKEGKKTASQRDPEYKEYLRLKEKFQ